MWPFKRTLKSKKSRLSRFLLDLLPSRETFWLCHKRWIRNNSLTRNAQSAIVGAWVRFVSLCTEKLMSGRVQHANHKRLPARDWNVFIVNFLTERVFKHSEFDAVLSLESWPIGVRTGCASSGPIFVINSHMSGFWSKKKFPSYSFLRTRVPMSLLTGPRHDSFNSIYQFLKDADTYKALIHLRKKACVY